MTITLQLNPDVERRLREEAARHGLTPEGYIQWLAEQALSPGLPASLMSQQTWETNWRAWAAGHQRLPTPAEDDRQGIYAGRGE
jgi:hypothetical protein